MRTGVGMFAQDIYNLKHFPMEEQKKFSGLKEVTQELVGWEDNKVMRTLSHLTTRPGPMILDYCQGGKQKYLSPVIYFFSVTALETYLASVSGLFDFILKANAESMRQTFSDPVYASSGMDVASIPDEFNSAFSFLFSETGQKLIFLPIFLVLTWLFYKKYNSSFSDISWFALYTLSHVTLLSIPLIMYWYITKDVVSYTALGLTIAFIYWVWASRQFFKLTWGTAIFLRFLLLVSVLFIMSLMGPVLMLIRSAWG